MDFDRSADIATDASFAALEAAIKSVKKHGPNLTETEAIGIMTGLLRAAGRWASMTSSPSMTEGWIAGFRQVLQQEYSGATDCEGTA